MVKVPHNIRGKGVEKSNKGVWIRASQEVSVYSVNKEPKSTDAYISLPVDVMGTEYYAMTYVKEAELVVVATQDNTQVSIKWPTNAGPTSVSYGGTTYGNGQTLTVTLNKFETFHALQGDSSADFTGAYITSNKPIGVVSGNKKVAVPANAGSADHLTEMLMSVDTWGKEFLTSSTPDRGIGDRFRILACEDNTKVTLASGQQYDISKAGYFKEIDLSTGQYMKITSDKPVLVAMFAKTWQNDGPNYGDPAMSIITPEPQYAADYTWSSVKDPTGADFNNKVSVIIEKSKKSGLRLDGNAISWREEKDIQGSTKQHLWLRVTPGSHNIYHTDPSVTFMALASGTFQVNSYAYAAGMRLAQINKVCVPTPVVAGDVLDNDCDGLLDEETLNGVDDDGDGAIDEDLALPPRVDGMWGAWASYGVCSVSCQGNGVKTRTRPCDSPAPANNGLYCVGTGSETASCNNGQCPVNGMWGSWSSYGSCSVSCGGGTKTRTRACDNPPKAHGGLDCAGSSTESASCNTGGCPVNGMWGTWASYGSCTVSCGGGTKTRTRACDNPPKANGGLDCVGSGTESATCNTGGCPVNGMWGSWGSYGSCSVSCGGGTKTRTRACDNPPKANGGLDCVGSGTDSTSCGTAGCAVDGNWGSWSSYGSCTVSCGGGTKTRTRACDNPPKANDGLDCVGSGTESATCNTGGCPVNGMWGSWGSFSSCSLTCGGGVKTRTRACDNPPKAFGGLDCASSGTDSASCNTNGCPVDGAWGNWAAYGACSVTCGSGTQSRSRACDSPAPLHGGTNCAGINQESRTCTQPACPTCSGSAQADVVFVMDASGSVGSSNFQAMREFVRDTVNYFDIASDKIRVGVQKYSSGTNTEFSLNDSYDKNTIKSNIMNIVYTRGGTNTGGALAYLRDTMFTAANGDRAGVRNIGVILTDGRSNSYQLTATEAAKCRNVSMTLISIGIGSGIPVAELNEIATDPDSDYVFSVSSFSSLGGIQSSLQQVACAPPPLINGGFTAWTAWSACSTTCALGTSTRSRTCTSPPPANGGADCAGDRQETTSCNLRPCPVDGAWSTWQAWAPCSVTCMGVGTRSRTRACDNPTPLHGGAQCPGAGAESKTCDKSLTLCTPGNGWAASAFSTTPGTPVDGGWGSWGGWSACSKTCGAGRRMRKRVCSNPVPQFGGLICTGPFSQKEICANIPCSAKSNYVQTCPERFFDCRDGNKSCVHYLEKCDCKPDCDDGSDEDQDYAGCISSNEVCQNSAHVFAPVSLLTLLLVALAALFPACFTSSDLGHRDPL